MKVKKWTSRCSESCPRAVFKKQKKHEKKSIKFLSFTLSAILKPLLKGSLGEAVKDTGFHNFFINLQSKSQRKKTLSGDIAKKQYYYIHFHILFKML